MQLVVVRRQLGIRRRWRRVLLIHIHRVLMLLLLLGLLLLLLLLREPDM